MTGSLTGSVPRGSSAYAHRTSSGSRIEMEGDETYDLFPGSNAITRSFDRPRLAL